MAAVPLVLGGLAAAQATATVKTVAPLTATAQAVAAAGTLSAGPPWWVIPRSGAVASATALVAVTLPLDPLAVFTAPPPPSPPALLADLPPFEQSSHEVQAVLRVVANELGRLDAARQALIQNFFPLTADVLLPMFETLLGLPVNPPATLSARRQLVATYMQRLKSEGRGLDWTALISQVVGTQNWNYQETVVPQFNFVPNPSFEYDAATPAAWAANAPAWLLATGATLSVNATGGVQGPKCLNVVTTAAVGFEGAACPLPGTFSQGVPYTASIWVLGVAGGEPVRFYFGTASEQRFVDIVCTTSWVRYQIPWTPSVDRTAVYIGVATRAAMVATIRLDGAVVTQGVAAPTYFDGDTTGHVWSGTFGNSTSSTSTSGSNAVSVNIPQAAAGVAWPFIRDLTPAHLAIIQGYTGGFIVGSSPVGSNL